MTNWQQYQEDAADFFRSLGLQAETNVTLQGVRTKHDIDVVVKSVHVGFEITWLVECKHWKSPVTKLHVLGLREIVSDLGADRGILLCEAGFQSGAIEAANLTNVQITSLAALDISARNDLSAMRLRELFDRIENCNDRYWDIDKARRIEIGLRPDMGENGYSGTRVIEIVRELISRSFRGLFPIAIDPFTRHSYPEFPEIFESGLAVVEMLEPMITELEKKLDDANAAF